VQRLGRAESIGPVLMGTNKPVAVLQHGTTVADARLYQTFRVGVDWDSQAR